MFQEGGAASLGAYQIRDKLTGEILIDLSEQPNFINQIGFNPYKILNDDTLEKGSAVLSILQQFQKRDAPQIGPFQAQEDLGTNLVDLGFSALRGTEPFVRGASRGLGELFGIQPLKEFGGKQEFDPSVGLGGIDLFKPTYDSYVPTDQDRSRGMIGLLNQSKKLQDKAPFLENFGQLAAEKLNLGYPFRDPNYNVQSDLDNLSSGSDVVDEATITQIPTSTVEDINISPEFTPRFESETLSLEGGPFDMETRRLAYQKEMIGRDEFGNLLPEGRLEQDDEISRMLEDIKPAEQKVDVDKTEADTLAENALKFGGLSQDEFRNQMDVMATPGLPNMPDLFKPTPEEMKAGQNFNPLSDTINPNDPIERMLQQPGFFGSNRFLDFIRNVGGELTRTGDIAQGLGFGASKAAEERAARELIEGQEERDYRMKLKLAKAESDLELRNLDAKGADTSMKKELRTVAQEVNADYNDIVSAKNTLDIVSEVESIINNEDTTSVKALTNEIFAKVGAVFDIDGKPSESGTTWDNLAPRIRAKVLLNQIKQKNIRDILGESGKTISNLDRQIVDALVGSLILGTTPQETLKALEMTRTSIFNNLATSQNRLKTNFYFADREGGMYLIQDNSNIMQYLQTGNLPSRLYNDRYNNNTALKKITLEG